MSLIYGNDVTDLKIKMIKEILSNLERNMKFTKEGKLYTFSFNDHKYDIRTIVYFFFDKNMIPNFEISVVFLGKGAGGGLCRVICTYMLRKLYNMSIDESSIMSRKLIKMLYKLPEDKMLGTVKVISKTIDIAQKCYIGSFEDIGFRLQNNLTKDIHSRGIQIFFKKDKPIEGWKKIDTIYEYEYKRLNIKYYIGEKSISVIKI